MAIDEEDPSAYGQCRVATLEPLLQGIYEHPEFKATFTLKFFDKSTSELALYFIFVDFDGALMTSMEGMILAFMRTLNQGGLIDDPYMQQLVMAMQGTESRGSVMVPARRIFEQLADLAANGIVVHGERRAVRWATVNDEKMITLLLNRAQGYCFLCPCNYMSKEDCAQPRGHFKELTMADYKVESDSWKIDAANWVSAMEKVGDL
jgi:hypothetical protein